MRVCGVLLAAGASSRFGSPKMLAPVPPDGRPMLAQVVDTWRAAGFAEIVVVLGYGAQALRKTIQERFLRVEESRAFAGARETDTAGGDLRPAARPPGAGAPPPVRFVENADWEKGMFSSVRAGLAAVDPSSTHAAISPADLPFLSKSSLLRVIEAVNLPEARGPETLLVPVCSRRRGHPLVIPAALVARVLAWPADGRLNRLFAEPDVKVLHLEGFDETILSDVDRPADLAAAAEAHLP